MADVGKDITDPTAVAFCNEKVRLIADQGVQYYNQARAVLAEWYARGGDGFVANSADDVVVDGAADDGRPEVDGADINSVMSRLAEYVADMEANGNAKLNTLLAVAVNTT